MAVASSSLDQPSLALPASGKHGFDLSAVLTAIVSVGLSEAIVPGVTLFVGGMSFLSCFLFFLYLIQVARKAINK